MPIQIIWTALPNGVSEAGALKLSVFVSLRLSGGTTLKDFPAVLNWAQTVQDIQFTVNFGSDDGPAIHTVPAKRVSPTPDNTLWTSLFDGTTPVKPYAFENLQGKDILSYSVKNIEAKIRDVYVRVAMESPTDLPTRQFVRPLVEDISFFEVEDLLRERQLGRELGPRAIQQLELEKSQKENARLNEIKSKATVVPGGPRVISSNAPLTPSFKTPAQRDFQLFRVFHRTVRMTQKERAALPRKLPTSEDFHERVSALGQYPYLLRLLGLTFDLEVPMDPQNAAKVRRCNRVWVTPSTLTGISFITPKTAFEFNPDARRFMALPRTNEISNGMLRLNDESMYSVVLVDAENAAFKLMNFAYNLMRREAYEVLRILREETEFPPVPQIAREEREKPTSQANVWTEQGDDSGSAQILPIANFGPSAPPVTPPVAVPRIRPELIDKLARLSVADKPLDEGLPMLRTDGIALVRTNRAVQFAEKYQVASNHNQNATPQDPTKVVLYYEDIMRGVRIDVREVPEGKPPGPWRSLCQRDGTYKFLKNPSKNFTHADEGFVEMAISKGEDGYMRLHEAIATWRGWSLCVPRPGNVVGKNEAGVSRAQLAQTAVKLGSGLDVEFKPVKGSLPRLRFGRTYQLRARVVDLAGNSLPLDSPDDSAATKPIHYARFEAVLPPMLVLREPPKKGEALEHMVIRTYNTTPADNTRPTSEVCERHVAPPASSQLDAEMHGMFDLPEGGLNKAAYQTIANKDGFLNTQTFTDSAGKTVEYAIESAPQLRLPYLPDPLALGVTFVNLPGMPTNSVRQISFEPGQWPEMLPFRLRLVEGTGEPKWDAKERTLTVFLPKAEIITVRYSCYLGQEYLRLMHIWRWVEEHGTTAKISPAVKPELLAKSAVQGRHWMLTPFRELQLVHAVQKPLQPPAFSKNLSIDRNFGETSARLSDKNATVHAKSTGKIEVLAEWEEPEDTIGDKPVRVQGKARVHEQTIHYPDKPQENPVQQIQWRHEFGDTKHRKVTYMMVATTRFQDYFSDEITSNPENITVTGPKITVSIPSSARPAIPKVLYVIPTFGWEPPKKTPSGITRKRSGGGLRVYLERPWFSSGDDELLGVVLWTPPKGAPQQIPDALKPYVTQWGSDPIWASGVPKPLPSLQDFKGAVRTETGLTLDELPDYRVSVVGYKVEYDEDRQLWYCDIEMDAGPAYYPFVRLALARYQPNSLQDAKRDVKLSRVVLADFAQLAPDRTTSVVFQSPTELLVTVSGIGYSEAPLGQSGTPVTSHSEVEVSVEVRRAGVSGEAAWMPVPNATFNLQLASVRGHEMQWTGKVTLPTPRDQQNYRLVIKEYERFITDKVDPRSTVAAVPLIERRLVYADVLEI